MKGTNTQYKRLGAILRDGRERAAMTPESAAMVLGLTGRSYLGRCELGHSNFPAKTLQRALRLYKIPVPDAVSAATADFADSLTQFLGGK